MVIKHMLETIQEYDPQNQSTWVPMSAPASHAEIERVQLELIRIGGLTPDRKPQLVIRWGATYQEHGKLKYWLANTEDVCTGYYYTDSEGVMIKVPHGKLDQIPDHKIALPLYEHTELGERRWVIEQWRSPEFMHRTGRADYQVTHDLIPDLLCCGHCDTPKVERGKPCTECGSRKEYETKGDGRQLIPDDFSQGHYDFFMRLEGRQIGCETCDEGVCTEHATYRAPNSLMLQGVENLWKYQQNRSKGEKAADNAAMDVRINVCNFCLREVEAGKKCPYCKQMHQAQMTPKTLEAQRRIWSQDNVARQKDLAEQEARRGPLVTVPSNYVTQPERTA